MSLYNKNFQATTNKWLLMLAILSFTIATSVFVLIAILGEKPPHIPPGGPMVITPRSDDGSRQTIYVANGKEGVIGIYETNDHQHPVEIGQISLDHVNGTDRKGHPLCIAFAPKSKKIYVVDEVSESIVIFDSDTNQELKRIPVGQNPKWVAITPDETKAYVSNEYPPEEENLSIIDLEKDKIVKKLGGLECPEGLAISPDGRKLLVTTQCGFNRDSLYIIDTSSDEVISSSLDHAVGITVAITPDSKKGYIARGNYHLEYPSPVRVIEEGKTPLSVVRIFDNKLVKTILLDFNVSTLCVTPNGKYVLVGNGTRVSIIDTLTDTEIESIQFDYSPEGLVVTDSKENRISVVHLKGTAKNNATKPEPSPGGLVVSDTNETVYVWIPSLQEILHFSLTDLILQTNNLNKDDNNE